MDATRRLDIELPEDLAEAVRGWVESGRFASESEVVRAGLALLEEQDEPDDEVEAWLRTEAVAAYDEWKSGKVAGLGIDEVLASLEESRAERERRNAAE